MRTDCLLGAFSPRKKLKSTLKSAYYDRNIKTKKEEEHCGTKTEAKPEILKHVQSKPAEKTKSINYQFRRIMCFIIAPINYITK